MHALRIPNSKSRLYRGPSLSSRLVFQKGDGKYGVFYSAGVAHEQDCLLETLKRGGHFSAA